MHVHALRTGFCIRKIPPTPHHHLAVVRIAPPERGVAIRGPLDAGNSLESVARWIGHSSTSARRGGGEQKIHTEPKKINEWNALRPLSASMTSVYWEPDVETLGRNMTLPWIKMDRLAEAEPMAASAVASEAETPLIEALWKRTQHLEAELRRLKEC